MISTPTKEEIARLLACLRKSKGYTQKEVAHIINLSQTAYSNLENTKGHCHSVSASEFFKLMEFYSVPYSPERALAQGLLDLGHEIVVTSEKGDHAFKVPRKFTTRQCINVRFVMPLINFVKSTYGLKRLNEIFDFIGIDCDYFYILDNQLNLRFLDEFLNVLVTQDGIALDQLSDISMGIYAPNLKAMFDYNPSCSPIGIIRNYLLSEKRYQAVYHSSSNLVEKNMLLINDTINPELSNPLSKSSELTRLYFVNLRTYGLPYLASIISENEKLNLSCELVNECSLGNQFMVKVS